MLCLQTMSHNMDMIKTHSFRGSWQEQRQRNELVGCIETRKFEVSKILRTHVASKS